MNPPIKRLLRTRADSRLAGVCGGLANYFDTDPVAIRLLVVALTIFTGGVPGILTYLAAWILVPEEPLPMAAPAPPPAGSASQANQAAG